MELETRHIAPYLQHVLKGYILGKYDLVQDYDFADKIVGGLNHGNCLLEDFKPILRPLSDFDDALEVEDFLGIGQWCDAYDEYFNAWFSSLAYTDKLVLQAPQPIFNYFLANHFDVFGLIKQGLAVDANSLKSEQ